MSAIKISDVADIYFYREDEEGTREIVFYLDNVKIQPSKEVDKAIQKKTIYVEGTIKKSKPIKLLKQRRKHV